MKKQEIAIVMAAGLGSRMGALTEKTPKPLVQVGGVPLIETIIKGLERRGVMQRGKCSAVRTALSVRLICMWRMRIFFREPVRHRVISAR